MPGRPRHRQAAAPRTCVRHQVLYFCSATSSQPALILDRLVARWLRENAGLLLNELRWSVSTYVRYLEIMFGWADELALAADELELCIFSTQAGGIGDSQWAPG